MADETTEQSAGGGPSRPPPSSGPPPMTKTRARLGTGRGTPSPGQPPAPPTQPPAEEPAEEPAVAAAQAEPAQPVAADQQPAADGGEAAAPLPPDRPAPPARPAAASPSAARPAPATRPADGEGAPARPAAARPTAAAVAPARPAAAARPVAAGAGTAVAERLGQAVRREPAPAGGGGAQAEGLVYVWPHLVTIEFIASLLLLLSMTILSWVVNAPLEARANPDHTPNPSKAPWYFLNLQELLLHMHPALAGVLVPAGALTLIAMIPYFDRDTRDVGKWFGTRNALPIAILVTLYTVIVEVAEVFWDAHYPVKVMMSGLAKATGIDYFQQVEPFGMALLSMPNTIVPLIFMLGPIVPLMYFIYRKYRPSTREVMVALFTGFVVSYVILTVFGTFFRGQGMQLYWPWDRHMIRID